MCAEAEVVSTATIERHDFVGPTGERPRAEVPARVRRMRIRTSGDDLADAFAAGAPDALRRAYDEHQRAVYSYCRRFVADQAADVTQEVFLAAWRSRERFDPSCGSLGGWIMGIARFKVADQLRLLYRNKSVASGDLTDVGAAGAQSVEHDAAIHTVATQILVAEALANLDEPGATWIRMAFVDGLSHSEIAATTGVPLGTVKSAIRRGLQRIRRDLEVFDGQA